MSVEDMSVSVVVPIFNSKEYLTKCIESILGQSHRNLEIILVDDGSNDGSELICDEFAGKDDRIIVIHRDNGGLVSARREGVMAASSHWISFVDSDDWIEKDMFEEMLKKAEECGNPDIVVARSFHEKSNLCFQRRGVTAPGVYRGKALSDIIPRMIMGDDSGEWGIEGSAWGKIYNRDLLLSVLERIDDRITYGEDGALVYGMIPRCDSIAVMDDCFYHYRIHSGSMATSYRLDTFEKLKLLKDYYEKEFTKLGIWEQQKEGVHKILLMFLMQAMKAIYGLDLGYQFPFGLVDDNDRIVLYGAGVVGKCYYNSLKTAGNANPVMWVDRNFEELCRQGHPVSSPKEMQRIEYDHILIAIEGKENFERIKKELIEMGASERKIVWKAPKLLNV